VSAPPGIAGDVAPGFGAVADEFARNFAERGEVGAAFAALRDGEVVVDLWGGLADRETGRAWSADTLQVVFSGTKAFVAVCLLILLDRGRLDLDAPVCRYWPEFEKADVLVRHAVSHTARLPGIERPVAVEELCDDRHMAALLAAQAPSDDPRARLCYHALTYGWLCGELVRRVDGRSVGRLFADEVAAPLGLEIWIGLPAELEPRVSRIELADDWPRSPYLREATFRRDPLVRSIWGNPPVFSREAFPWNEPAFHRAEIPGAGGIGTARSIAMLDAGLGGLLSPEALRFARTPLAEGWDEAHQGAMRFGVGFALQGEERQYGPVAEAFGHGGAGGSVHGAWPEHGVGFAYTMNLMRDGEEVDARPAALLAALARSLG
jgi:CubicO group peptidase (beta-lactamase class C family)